MTSPNSDDATRIIPKGMSDDSLQTFDPTRLDETKVVETEVESTSSRSYSVWNLVGMEQQEGAFSPSGNTYTLEEVIGKGGFGEVWRARQHALGREVAIKRFKEEIREDCKDSAKFSKFMTFNFEMEALTTAALDHPNIVTIHDLGADQDGSPLIAMKLVRGQSWSDAIKKDFQGLPLREYLQKHLSIFIDICQATAYAHSRGILHRDIKPAQVMIGEFGEVQLMDWGLAVIFDTEKFKQQFDKFEKFPVPTVGDAQNPAGTPAFMAPEQTDKTSDRLGPWTDVYLLGATLYHLLTLKAPHMGKTPLAFAEAKEGEYTKLEDLPEAERVPQELKDLVEVCLEADIEERKKISPLDIVQWVQDYLSCAGERDKAEKLVHEFEEVFEKIKGKGSYEKLDRCQDILRRAREAWNQHPKYPQLQNRLYEEISKTAIRSGDLALAEMYVRQIIDSELREKLKGEIEEKWTAEEAIKRQRKVFLGSAFFLVAVVILTMVYYNAQVAAEREKLQESLEVQEQLSYDMGERVKELTCLYGVSDSLQHHDNFEDVFEDTVRLIPPAWQFPGVTTARITFDGEEFTSDPFQASDWRQAQPISVLGEERGMIEVFYTEERPESDEGPFLSEERDLINALSKLLGEAIEANELSNKAASLDYDIGERRKELKGIYTAIKSVATESSLEAVVEDYLELIPPAWQFPEITAVRVTIGEQTWTTNDFKETPWVQKAHVEKDGVVKGSIEVVYLEEKPESAEGPFLSEERDLIDALADVLANF